MAAWGEAGTGPGPQRVRGQCRWASSLAGTVRDLGVGSALGRVPSHLCPCSGPRGSPEGPRTAPWPPCPPPASRVRSTATALFLPCPHGVVCLSHWEHRGVSVLSKESPRVKGLQCERAGESSFPKPFLTGRGSLLGLLGELGVHAGRTGPVPVLRITGSRPERSCPKSLTDSPLLLCGCPQRLGRSHPRLWVWAPRLLGSLGRVRAGRWGRGQRALVGVVGGAG